MNVRTPVAVFVFERLALAAFGAAAALALFAVLAFQVHAGATQRLDRGIQNYFQLRQQPTLNALMTAVSLLASGWTISVVSAACVIVFLLKPALRADAVSLLLAAPGGQGVVYGLKEWFHRARPEAVFASMGYSFPSGHSFAAVTLYGMLAYWLTRSASSPRRAEIWWGAILLILLIGFSRVYLGVHYASDVAAGFAAGVPWLWGCLALPARDFARRASVKETL